MQFASPVPGATRGTNTNKLIICCAFVTYAMGLIVRLPTFENKPIAFLLALTLDTVIVILGVVMVRLVIRSRLSDVNLTAFLAVLVNAMFCALLILGVAAFIRAMIAMVPQAPQPIILIFVYYTFVFCLWGMAACWLKMQARMIDEAVQLANAERAVAVSELRRLRMQLDPHFLFNALNTALVEVNQQPKRAVRMLRELSNYLRYSLDNADAHFVPVSVEMAMIRSFLRVQDIRFGAKLKYRVVAQDGAKRRLIPTFLLLPLIENATKYGVPNDDNVLQIDVDAAIDAEALVITIANSGDLSLAKSGLEGTGTGLNNLHARLALHYPGRHDFSMAQVGENVVATCLLRGEPC